MPRNNSPCSSLIFFLFCIFLLLLHVLGHSPTHDRTSEAYVTLLYGDEFALGVRVLGKSLRDTGTRKDMVALVSDGVSDRVIDLLQADGWLIEKIDLLANPNNKRPKRFWGVYTKLKIFNMTNYKKVVYLDADTVVRKSIEDLFRCEKFCANLKHSERLNSGVMVVEPSQDLFEDMMAKVNTLPSYTGGYASLSFVNSCLIVLHSDIYVKFLGDQGFLNSYYVGFPNAHLFDPDLSNEERKLRKQPTMERLSTLYNADVGLYMLANKWMVDETELRVIHYTLGPLKPWDWWTAWLLEPVRYWQDVRVTLEESLPGTSGGQDPRTRFYVWVLGTCPMLALIFICRNCLFQLHKYVQWNGSLVRCTRHYLYKFKTGNTLPYYSHTNGSPSHISNIQHASGISGMTANNVKVPACFGPLSVAACFISAGISFGVALFLIPNQVMPWTGLFLLYEWTFFLFGLLYSWYLDTMLTWGRMSGGSSLVTGGPQSDYGKGAKHLVPWDGQILFLFASMASLAILAPSLPLLFGVTALFSRLGMVIGGAMALVAFMTYSTQYLAIRWFLHGFEHANLNHLDVDLTRL